MRAEFSERQFEFRFNHILLSGNLPNLNLYIPTQNQENNLGFDVALFTINETFWSFFWDIRWLVNPFNLRNLEGIIHNFEIICNAFIQYKRPEYLSNRRSMQRTDWGRPYYRYGIRGHQQELLASLGDRINEQWIVVYASPAFHTFAELNGLTDRGIIETTNFCEPRMLDRHNYYTYDTWGIQWIAHSTPESIKSKDFFAYLKGNFFKKKKKSNIELMKELWMHIDTILSKDKKYLKKYNQIKNSLHQDFWYEESEIIDILIKIHVFSLLTSSTYVISIKMSQ